MSKLSVIDALQNGLVKACERERFIVRTDVGELLKTETKSSKLLSAISEETSNAGTTSPQRSQRLLEEWGINELRGVFVKNHSHYAIQIGVLDEALIVGEWPDDYRLKIMERWHSHQQLAAIARTWLVAEYSDDLNLFLIGPPGSASEDDWINFSQAVERNDLVCRKLVWLPSKNESKWPNEVAAFLARSFMAKPWESGSQLTVVPLDSLSDVSATLTEWSEILDDPAYSLETRDYDALVEELLKRFQS